MEAVLDLMRAGDLRLAPLISHRFDIDAAEKAYDLIAGGATDSLGILLTYPSSEESVLTRRVDLVEHPKRVPGEPGVGFIGAGSFATSTLLPAMKRYGNVRMTGVCTASGISAQHAAKKFGFDFAATAIEELLLDDSTDAIAIATRHDRHAAEICAVLRSDRHVFCEKPLCLNVDELKKIVSEWHAHRGQRSVMVGFNRRFAPLARQLRTHVAGGAGGGVSDGVSGDANGSLVMPSIFPFPSSDETTARVALGSRKVPRSPTAGRTFA